LVLLENRHGLKGEFSRRLAQVPASDPQDHAIFLLPRIRYSYRNGNLNESQIRAGGENLDGLEL